MRETDDNVVDGQPDEGIPPGHRPPGAIPLVIITGLSGAGKSTAMRVYEDLGWYCVDNLPPGLIAEFFALYMSGRPEGPGVVIASDIRSGKFFNQFLQTVEALQSAGTRFELLYLDANSHVLMNRFREVRRNHPLEPKFSLKDAIEEERSRLEPIRAIATTVIDTSQFNTAALRAAVMGSMSDRPAGTAIRLKFVSFGFKYGVPGDADFVFDARFLPNPFYEPTLKELTGQDDPVYEFVMSRPGAREYLDRIISVIDLTLDPFVGVGKLNVTVAVGCTGGRHRSVSYARALTEHYTALGRQAMTVHRDAIKPQA